MELQFYKFKLSSDSRGSLVAIEELLDIPFRIKRVYFLFATRKDVRRGMHAHKQLQQILVCVSGSCKVLLDNGFERDEVVLDDPAKGLFIDKGIWREMYDFSHDAVLLVLASEHYSEEDYIRDYMKFRDMCAK